MRLHVRLVAAATALVTGWTVWPVTAGSQTVSETTWLSSPDAGFPVAFAGGSSSQPAISADGTVVAFTAAPPTQTRRSPGAASQVFVHDSKRPTASAVELVSVGADSLPVENTSSSQPSVSCDGRFVAFTSNAALDPDDDDGGALDVYVRDRLTATTELASAGIVGTASGPAISADGRYVAMVVTEALQTRVSPAQVYVYDRVEQTARLISRPPGSGEGGDGDSFAPAITLDGGLVAFASVANLDRAPPGEGPPTTRIFVWRRSDDTVTTVSVSLTGGRPDGPCGPPAITQDGKLIAYACLAANLVPNDSNQVGDVFVTDWAARTTRVASATSGQLQANGDSCLPSAPGRCDARVSISPDGRFVAFASAATNLLDTDGGLFGIAVAQAPSEGGRDTNGAVDVFVRDFRNQKTSRASVLPDGSQITDGDSLGPAISYGGRRTAFVSTSRALTGNACHPQTCAPNTFVRADSLICVPCQSGECPAAPVFPALRVSSTIVREGRATTAFGVGFPPTAAVDVTVDGRTTAVTSDATGAFQAPVVVPHDTLVGTHRVQARSGTRSADASFLVVRRPQQPPFPSLS